MTIYTAGYEGLSIDAFIACLKRAQIHKVLDVREYPLSRKPGFSKKAFAQCLAEAGIAYEHCSSLGCPKSIRRRYKVDGDWYLYAREFGAYIRTQSGLLQRLLVDSAQQRICMVCYEADPAFCHRSLIAEAAFELDFALEIRHLTLKKEAVIERLKVVA